MHILISFRENPGFSPITTSLGTYCSFLIDKAWIGFDKNGNESTNGIEMQYVLIKDCTDKVFESAISIEQITYRIIHDNELIKHHDEKFKITLDSIFSRGALNKTIDPLCLFLQQYHELIIHSESLLPFILIQYLASGQFAEFLAKAISIMDCTIQDKDEALITSCVNTVCALSLIFLGQESAKKGMNFLQIDDVHKLRIPLVSGKIKTYAIDGLFAGRALCVIPKNTLDLHGEMAIQCRSYKAEFQTFIQPEIDKCVSLDDAQAEAALEKCFRFNSFDFNAATFQSLEKEIRNNAKETQSQKSHIYIVLIKAPTKKNPQIMATEHIFIIEQFYCKNTVRYRIYQSWIFEETLQEDLKRRQYGPAGENSMDLDEIVNFILQFAELYANKLVRATTSKECFGVFNSMDKMPRVRMNDQVLTGTTVRYYSEAINPRDCLKNIYDNFREGTTLFQNPQPIPKEEIPENYFGCTLF